MTQTPLEPTMTGQKHEQSTTLVHRLEALIGRPLTDSEVELAHDLANEKTPEIIARELQAAPITDPKKIRPEHKDTADE